MSEMHDRDTTRDTTVVTDRGGRSGGWIFGIIVVILAALGVWYFTAGGGDSSITAEQPAASVTVEPAAPAGDAAPEAPAATAEPAAPAPAEPAPAAPAPAQ